MMKSTLFRNCRLAFPDDLIEGALQITGGSISAIWIGETPTSLTDGQTIDCAGLVLAPGLIDIHNHGGMTHDFVAGNSAGNNIALKYHAENGVTSLLATVMTETHEQMSGALQALRKTST